ncbi:thiamine-phosphate kinase [Aurantiacibacter sp. 219JJ12-13]|uniref:thiamine-phosphate kinase n=1 Tax=Aurantiacibacter poecillastricola TaxID=3064385 RepID=UPI00273D3E56|nr:thiamine-phosphate kinase [Aurantiacibacter sp. 219JJ12-13]MDP5262507.1 thiamine-phosphate kinase [Aurantiacibacter sp. 219JJ12-13]
MNEADFIAALRALPLDPGARGLADDAATLDVGGETLILTHDTMCEGVHFLPSQDMADVAWKLVTSNLSDLAAMGARPLGVLLSHTLGEGDERFLVGMAEVLARYEIGLLGGDTVSGRGERTLGLTAVGLATHKPAPARSGAQVGDALYVTGTLGAAMLGFEVLKGEREGDLAPYTRPEARVAEGMALAPHVTAMMDVSDGLLLDAFRMAEASETSIAIDTAACPVADPDRRMECLTWGDDYELLFTLPADTEPPVPATRIGAVEPRGFASLFVDREPIVSREGLGYQHQQSSPSP